MAAEKRAGKPSTHAVPPPAPGGQFSATQGIRYSGLATRDFWLLVTASAFTALVPRFPSFATLLGLERPCSRVCPAARFAVWPPARDFANPACSKRLAALP